MLSVAISSTIFVCVQAAGVEQMRCNNKTRFILAVVAGKLKISNRKRADIEEQLVSDGFDKMPNRGATVSLPWPELVAASCNAVMQISCGTVVAAHPAGANGPVPYLSASTVGSQHNSKAQGACLTRHDFALQCSVDAAAPWLQALTGPPTQDSIEDTSGSSYDYLLGMPIQNLTVEKVCTCTD